MFCFIMVDRIHLTNCCYFLIVCDWIWPQCMQSICKCERVPVSVCALVVWQGPMEEYFLCWMDFTLYRYIRNKNLNQCWAIVNWSFRNKPKRNTNQNTKLFIHENTSEIIVCEMVAILSRGDEWNMYLSLQSALHFYCIYFNRYLYYVILTKYQF